MPNTINEYMTHIRTYAKRKAKELADVQLNNPNKVWICCKIPEHPIGISDQEPTDLQIELDKMQKFVSESSATIKKTCANNLVVVSTKIKCI